MMKIINKVKKMKFKNNLILFIKMIKITLYIKNIRKIQKEDK